MTTQMPPSSSPYSPGDGAHSYGNSPDGRPPARGTNTMAILALVFVFVFSPLAIVFGIVGRRQIARTGESGRGLATAGLILGSLSVLIGVVVAVVVGVAAVGAANSAPTSSAPAVGVPAVPAPAAPAAGAATAVTPEAVAAQIEGQTQGRATGAVCPGPLEARVGASVTCSATVDEEQRDITATVTEVQGSSVLFDIRG